MKEITQSEKVSYFKISLGLVGIHTDERTCAMLIATYECFLKLGAEFSVNDAVAIKMQNEKDYPPKD